MRICPGGGELFHADGQIHRRTDKETERQTDMTKIIVALHNFANSPKTLKLHEEVPQNIIP